MTVLRVLAAVLALAAAFTVAGGLGCAAIGRDDAATAAKGGPA